MARAPKVNTEENELFVVYSILQALDRLIGRFAPKTIDEIESVIKKRERLRLETHKFSVLCNGDGEKAKELWFTNSTLPKSEIAFLDPISLNTQLEIAEKKFTIDEIEVIKYWLVKQ